MTNDPKNEFNIAELQRFAGSNAGKELIKLLNGPSGDGLRAAAEKASTGNMKDAKRIIEEYLSKPEAKTLLESLGAANGK